MSTVLRAIFIALCVQSCIADNILFFWPISSFSHKTGIWPLVEALAERGHNITFLTPFPSKTPAANVTEVVLKDFPKKVFKGHNFLKIRMEEGPTGIRNRFPKYFDFGLKGCDVLLSDKNVLEWAETSSYDLVILNTLKNDCGLGFAHKFKAPHMIYGTSSPFGWWTDAYGFPDEVLPEFMYYFPSKMTLYQRVLTALAPLYWNYYRQSYMFPRLETMLRNKLKMPNMPDLVDIQTNVSLLLLNSHPTDDYARSLPPNVEYIAGLHIAEERSALHKDIADFVDSKNFVYFSLGTFADPSVLGPEFSKKLFGTMGEFPEVNFLVKWTGDPGPVKPKNVMIVDWVPQQDLLAHKNIKGFISHGGIYGSQEAAYFGVPMILLPIFGDQDFNAHRIQESGRGIVLEISSLNKKDLSNAINTILSNPQYAENAKRTSILFRERQSKPLESALWWTEHVLRHKGNLSHLKPKGLSQSWYERRNLDIWACLTLMLFGTTSVVGVWTYFLIKSIGMTDIKKKMN